MISYNEIEELITEEAVEKAILQVLSTHERIEYSREGFNYLLDEVKKLIPSPEVVISCQSIEEMAVTDRIERKAPKFYVSYK